MSVIGDKINEVKEDLPDGVQLVAVSKFHSSEEIMDAYIAGQRSFGENRPQEMFAKIKELPDDIKWHFIGHLQKNKIKLVVPYASLIHSVDSENLLMEIENYSLVHSIGTVDCLFEVFIAKETTKQGFEPQELLSVIKDRLSKHPLEHVRIRGLMGMASFVDDSERIKMEFSALKDLFDKIRETYSELFPSFDILSMGMTGDYKIAVACGSNMVRIGTKIFGPRNY
ncbi:MAG: YggS family pyridoxal phosphate-dependent enzyme [Bacteroidales bacterium]|jgi:pyridoxal phosphate enzyme (YggS family)|nr:YggS family pyridoxal phosphate-dependent enzyme [Bacteroidales bacterium]